MFNLTKLSTSLGLATLLSVKFILGALITLFSLSAQADGFFVGTSASLVQAKVAMSDDSKQKLKINQQNINLGYELNILNFKLAAEYSTPILSNDSSLGSTKTPTVIETATLRFSNLSSNVFLETGLFKVDKGDESFDVVGQKRGKGFTFGAGFNYNYSSSVKLVLKANRISGTGVKGNLITMGVNYTF
jgi:hypothetical protein